MRFDATVDGRTVQVDVRGREGRYTVSIDGRSRTVDARESGPHLLSLLVEGRSQVAAVERRAGGYTVHLREDTLEVEMAEVGPGATAPRRGPAGPTRVVAPMPGRLVRVLVEAGQEVRAGQGLLVMEAMKMENELRAPVAGRVAEVHARERQAVDTGDLLVVLD